MNRSAGWPAIQSGRAALVWRLGAVLVALALSGGCSSGGGDNSTAAERQSKPGGPTKPKDKKEKPTAKPTQKQKPSPGGTDFRFAAGAVSLRRAGFDTLRISRIAPGAGWRGRIDDNFDDSVDAVFVKGRRRMELKAELDDGRLQVQACEDFTRVSGAFKVGNAGTVSLQRIGDEDLRVSRATAAAGWRARVTDNNSEDVEVIFAAAKKRVEFDAQTDDGRIEASVCTRLR